MFECVFGRCSGENASVRVMDMVLANKHMVMAVADFIADDDDDAFGLMPLLFILFLFSILHEFFKFISISVFFINDAVSISS